MNNSFKEAHLDPSPSWWIKGLNMFQMNIIIAEILAIQKVSAEVCYSLQFDQLFPEPEKSLLSKFLLDRS